MWDLGPWGFLGCRSIMLIRFPVYSVSFPTSSIASAVVKRVEGGNIGA